MATTKKKPKRRPGRPEAELPKTEAGRLTPIGRVAAKIRKARKDQKMTAADCAKRAKISTSRWYEFERGDVGDQPPAATLWAIESAVGLPANSLVSVIYPAAGK
jgi:ribosome-binding protein aMBF1 (putative translation factor)